MIDSIKCANGVHAYLSIVCGAGDQAAMSARAERRWQAFPAVDRVAYFAGDWNKIAAEFASLPDWLRRARWVQHEQR